MHSFQSFLLILEIICFCAAFDESLLKLQQEDPKLIKIIKEKFLIPPKDKKSAYNFSVPLEMLNIKGQEEQPIIINEQIFKNRLFNGFFIEAGAYNGESISNTLFYELRKGTIFLLFTHITFPIEIRLEWFAY